MTLEELLHDPPRVHEPMPGKLISWGLPKEMFQFIYNSVGPTFRTFETGAGISTVLFALRGTRHTCVCPDKEEVDRLCAYCTARGISMESVSFEIDRSDQFFRTQDLDELDFVLIDGGHGFPTPFLDWFYTASRLKVGGILVIDDTQLWTGAVLKEFLLSEPEWQVKEPFSPKTAIFVKKADYFPWKKEWDQQPYVKSRTNELNLPPPSKFWKALDLARKGEYATLMKKALKQLTR